MPRYSLTHVLATVRYLFSCVGWDYAGWAPPGSITIKDNRGHCWRVTCEPVDP